MAGRAYRFGFDAGESVTLFADTGELMDELTVAQSRTAASRFVRLPEDRVRLVATITSPDQWTLLQGARCRCTSSAWTTRRDRSCTGSR